MKANILYSLFVILFITACSKSGSDDSMTANTNLQELIIGDEDNDPIDGKDKKGFKGKNDCFELIFPISISMPDESTLTGEKVELWEDVKAWYEANPASNEKPTLIYPVEILWLADDVVKPINDKKEMGVAKKYCYMDKGVCFKLVYPVSWNMPDGSEITMNDHKDWDELKAWYEDNPQSEEKPSLNYPVEIEYKDGVVKAVADLEEMILAKKECE